ncbi:helix-turn-helix domain-containing protein [Shouchella patagoniensis]|uniref:helix-turn-helix domain-containing protein n=1 Tax=Shouchella patagoniensis TaxID=228576 RepID=UPI00099596F2|nr:helix-turn-helix domain-containing protein [Shouchella patagoniensis]
MRSLWMKLLVYGGLIGTIPVIIVGLFAYFQSTNHAEQRVANEKMELMRQVKANIEQVLTTVHHSLNNTIESPTMAEAIRKPLLGNDFQLYRNLRRELSRLQSFDTKVEETIVLNNEQNWIVTNQGISRLDAHPDEDRYISFFELPNNTTWLLLETESFEEAIIRRHCPYTISLVKKLPTRLSDKYGLAFANIPMCSIKEMILSDEISDELMILDEKNQIIVHSDEEVVGKSFVDLGFSEPAWTNEAAGQTTVDLDNESYALTYTTSNLNGWKYVSLTSMNELMSESRSIGWFTFYMVLSMIVLTTFVVWVYSRKLYSPVRKLVAAIHQKGTGDEKKQKRTEFQVIEDQLHDLFSSKKMLEQELTVHTKQSLMLFLMRVYQGRSSTTDSQERLRLYGLDKRINGWGIMSLFVIHLEHPRHEEDQEERELRAFALRNIIDDTVPEENRLPAVWIDDLLVVVVGLDEYTAITDAEAAVYHWSENIKAYMQEYMQTLVSIGISEPFKAFSNSNIAFAQGTEALTHRFKFNENVIIYYRSIQAREKVAVYHHPSQTEEELLLAIRLADREKAEELFEIWLNAVMDKGHTVGEVHVSFMHLISRMLRFYHESGWTRSDHMHLSEATLYQECLHLRSQDKIKDWFSERLLYPLLAMFKEISESQFQDLSQKMINYIKANDDTAITLEQCAADLHYNANYLSSVFKKGTGMTFSDYVADHRLKEAKKWLHDTDIPIKQIAERLGYKNSQNFIRSFKKSTGMTPGQYRQEKGME